MIKMKIFICCSKTFYDHIPEIKDQLEHAGHVITLPNSFDDPTKESQMHQKGVEHHSKWKASMLRAQAQKIQANDAILVLNFIKNGQPNYIGGATFLEMYKAFELGKKIFLYNDIPGGILRDEILAFEPTLIQRDLAKIN